MTKPLLTTAVALAAVIGVAAPALAMGSSPRHTHRVNVSMSGSMPDGQFATELHGAAVSVTTQNGAVSGTYAFGQTATAPAGSHVHTNVPVEMESANGAGRFSASLHDTTLAGRFGNGQIRALEAAEPVAALTLALGLVALGYWRRR